MATIHIRNWLTGKIIHSVQVDRESPLFPLDLRGANLMNADLRCASLSDANLEGAVLLGANLSEADLCRANLRSSDLRYSNLDEADLRDADLSEVEAYPANTSKSTKLGGANLTPGSELEAMSQQINEARCRLPKTYRWWNSYHARNNQDRLRETYPPGKIRDRMLSYQQNSANIRFL